MDSGFDEQITEKDRINKKTILAILKNSRYGSTENRHVHHDEQQKFQC